MSKPSTLGGACIIASVCVGAGMLGLPSAGAGAWTLWTVLAISVTMVMMTLSGWLLLEALKHYEFKVSFNTITKDVLKGKVNAINNLSLYFVGGILLYAYISSSGMIFGGLLDINPKLASVLFVIASSVFVLHSTRAVDRISILLILFMIISFVIGISGLAANIQLPTLLDSIDSQADLSPYALAILPVALTSFGYHHSVSTMRDYYRDENRAKNAILGGTLIALTFYVIWVICIFGNLPRTQFGPIVAAGGSVDALMTALGGVVNSNSVKQALNIFSIAAVVSSFIGVGLGVFDYLADLFGFEDTNQGRFKAWGVTFIPPLVFSLFAPFGFVAAIGLAGAAATIWTCIIPALLAKKLRQRQPERQGFVVPGGNVTVYAVIIFGVLTACFHLLAMADVLPIFKG
ncbi:transposase [Photobacterium aquimaris]|uniref:Aromatic amino acid permease n=1 Tax=Photobacterium aquimaris TaxID=512643 RepID=A0A2T3IG79_9GAMM|nr:MULTISPECIES: aromatic amino acid transport family protein [Photobacterium]OBU16797.1 transposase [Photobacterium aquimaris]OBU18948.1 transposase [Photobacterium aquimaris]PSU25795.1 transposase [Photobacterium aquimaris]PSV97986.1 transposase [Photobacterium aquimaris]